MQVQSEEEFNIECIRCLEVVHSDTLDFYGRCDCCQERDHERQERPD
jgi:Zn finger protein HypA/HybF involved in hydrogenase expression